ncbi:MAG: HlyD family efflux transporter periplasmic adaptor subunit [Acidobacteria bacterium]|nr:HlyD family efflux transporter periplasmic adaptor subunit [Acidobacteriota bacterium]
MDIQRKGAGRRKLIRRIGIGAAVLIIVPLITWGLSRLKPAAPTVERSTVWVDQVKRGPMLRQVRGLGSLVAEEPLQIASQFEGRVEKRLLPGVDVTPETVLLVLSNPDLELSANDYEWQVKQAKAAYEDLKVKLESQKLDQESLVAQQQSAFTQAKLTLDRDRELEKLDLKPALEVKLSEAKFEESKGRLANEQKRLAILSDSVKAQLDSQTVQIQKLQATFQLKKKQYEQMTIRAGTRGVLKEVNVEVGQRVAPGAVLAKVVQPWRLKAELKIPETQVKDIVLNQDADIDTRNGHIQGKVMRIDPAAVNGTVTVDVKLIGELPHDARPDLSVDGTIEIERLADVVYVGRPVFGQPNSQITLFKLEADGKNADRVPVKLGRSSVNTIEIVDGLKVGDQVILSDMSTWDAQNRIRLN